MGILSFHFQTVLYILVDTLGIGLMGGMGLRQLIGLSNTKIKNGNFSEILSAHDSVIVQSKWDQPSTFSVDMIINGMKRNIERKRLSVMIFV